MERILRAFFVEENLKFKLLLFIITVIGKGYGLCRGIDLNHGSKMCYVLQYVLGSLSLDDVPSSVCSQLSAKIDGWRLAGRPLRDRSLQEQKIDDSGWMG